MSSISDTTALDANDILKNYGGLLNNDLSYISSINNDDTLTQHKTGEEYFSGISGGNFVVQVSPLPGFRDLWGWG